MDARETAPSPERNKQPILEVLARVLPPRGLVLEIGSGTGQHVAHFARALPALTFQPSEMDVERHASIEAWVAAGQLSNVRPPLAIDVMQRPWPVSAADAVVCINVIHIAAWEATLALMAGAGSILPAGGVLVTYGPYRRGGAHTSPSNEEFDTSLRARNPLWGVRDIDEVAEAAGRAGLALQEAVPMPANNFTLVWRKTNPLRPHDTAPPTSAAQAVRALWTDAGLAPDALDRLELRGREPALPSSFAVGTALQASLGAAAAAAAELGALTGGPQQLVTIDIADAVCEGSCRFLLNGQKPRGWDPLSGLYRCGGDTPRHVRVHTNFAHHRDGVLQLLGLPPGADTPRSAVEAALAGWDALAFEAAADARGLVVAALRSPAEWHAHPQAAAVSAAPLVAIEKIGDAPARRTPFGNAAVAPLDGLRVLDLTRILAGPVAGRTLAAYGADVLLVNGPHLPNIDAIADTSRGKRSAQLDLREAAGVESLRALVGGADVFLQGYRPGALAARGFAPGQLAQLRPGIVVVSLSAYGDDGPWGGKRGFDSLVQSATGLNLAEAEAFGEATPRALPLQALDIGAGFLLAFGALAALHRQCREGGSWQVRVSLAGVGRWLDSLGRIDGGPAAAWPDVDAAMQASDSGFGRLVAVRHAARFSATPARWRLPSMPPGSHAAAWA